MSSNQHKARAEELAASAAKVYAVVGELTATNGGVEPTLHAGLFREMHAIAVLAQVHATLATTRDAGTENTLAQVRQLAETWDEQDDDNGGPDAADFLVRLRPLLGLPNPD